MDVILLDTDVVSFLFKGDSRARQYAPHLEGHVPAISFMTVAELFQWAAVRDWGPRRMAGLEMAFQNYTVLPFDIALCRMWGEVRAQRWAIGRPISPQDAWIAATALRHQIPLITHNSSDFEAVEGLVIITEAGK
jgi:tRNA(fMet)-specific endonuclease VapC